MAAVQGVTFGEADRRQINHTDPEGSDHPMQAKAFFGPGGWGDWLLNPGPMHAVHSTTQLHSQPFLF